MTLLAFLKELRVKQDAGSMPHEVNVSEATPVVHIFLRRNTAVLPMTWKMVAWNILFKKTRWVEAFSGCGDSQWDSDP